MQICLNMIVKNESKTITRLIKSVSKIIDKYFICDTGSTDDTIDIIKREMGDIPGEIIYKPFINFGINRTYSLQEAKKWCGKDHYLLFLDADMILKIGKNFDKLYLNKDVYYFLQGNEYFQYYNIRLVSTNLEVDVKCPTHEYYDILTSSFEKERLLSDFIFIEDIGDGGSKIDKYTRDIKLLKDGLVTEPKNGRYMFYIANSYYDISNYNEAINWYRKLINNGSWIEEVYYSWYKLGMCYLKLNNTSEMVLSWMNGYEILPSRVETLYELIKWYRQKGKYNMCNLFYEIAKNIKYPVDCSLFIHKNVYDYLLLEEYTIFGYYVNKRNLSSEMFYLMQHKPINSIYSLFYNYKFYQVILKEELSIKFDITFDITFDESIKYSFISSTPSIIKKGNDYIVNVRLVNYTIDKNGTYPYIEHIVSINQCLFLSSSFETIKSQRIIQKYENKRYIGIEDIKLFDYKNKMMYVGTGFDGNNLCMYLGEYLNSASGSFLNYKNQNSCEKNWVIIPDEDEIKMIYKWYPLTIGKIKNNELIITMKKEMPQIFSLARGSTNGSVFKQEIWFIVHYIYDDKPRNYYHSFVVFDLNMNLLKYSIPFKFTSGEIEFSLGLIVEDEKIIITHSVWDRESYLKIYSKNYILNNIEFKYYSIV